MTVRPFPDDLAHALRQAAQLERLAANHAQRRRAIAATATLLAVAVDVGWRASELASVLAMRPSTVRRRIARRRARRGRPVTGLTVTPAPRRDPPPPEVPLEQRRWLTAGQVRQIVGISPKALAQWRRAGLLPATRAQTQTCYLYARTDLDRILRAPRRGKVGVNRTAVLAAIHAEAADLFR